MQITTAKYTAGGVKAVVDGVEYYFNDKPQGRIRVPYEEWIAQGNTPEPEFTQAELDQQVIDQTNQVAKAIKQESLASLTVTTSFGNTFDGNETARVNMLSAIEASAYTGIVEKEWKMADNSKVVITLDELKEAQSLAIQAVGVIVVGTP